MKIPRNMLIHHWHPGKRALVLLTAAWLCLLPLAGRAQTTNLTLQLFPNLLEGYGTLTNAATVSIPAVQTEDLTVSLTSSDLTELLVPNDVTILTGQTSVVFNLTVVDDGTWDGLQAVTVTATAVGYEDASGVATVSDGQAEIRGLNWHDLDDDGLWDAGEPVLAGSRMYADLNRDGLWDPAEPSGISDTNGAFAIGVPAGAYLVGQASRSAWFPSAPGNDTTDRGLSFLSVLKDGTGGVDGLNGAQALTLSPDGRFVYVASGGANLDNAVAVFRRDATNGLLTFVQVVKDGVGGVDGLNGAQSIAVSPDGAHAYVAGNLDNAIAVFRRDATSGLLSFAQIVKDGVGGADGLAAVTALALAPDGLRLYAVSTGDDGIVLFRRDPATGQLTYRQLIKDGVSGVDGLLDGRYVAASADGLHVYVASSGDNALSVFRWNPVTDMLNYVQMVKDGVLGVDGLAGVNCVELSPDGNWVYAAGTTDNALPVFQRDAATGRLTYTQLLKDAVAGVDGLAQVMRVTASADGLHVYASAGTTAVGSDQAVAVFRRTANGQLAFAQILKDGVAGVDGLSRARGLMVAPDGKHLYVAGNGDLSVAAFARSANSPLAGTWAVAVSRSGAVQGLQFGDVREFNLLFAESVAEGSVSTGQVLLAETAGADVAVTLASDDPTEAQVAPSAVVTAGQSRVAFVLTTVADGELDADQTARITASAVGYRTTSRSVIVRDADTAVLTVTVPASVREGAGMLTASGTVSVATPVSVDFTVSLTSSDPASASVPAQVTLPAGQSSAEFDVQIPENGVMDGDREVTIRARVERWTDGAGRINVLDNEHTNLMLSVIGSVLEGTGAISDAGRVSISGTRSAALTVSLISSDETELTLPAEVTIPAGSTTVTFNVTAPDDGLWDGAQAVRVQARAAGLGVAAGEVSVLDAHAQIRGAKWFDLDGDGVRDSDEPGLADWKIFVDADRDGVWDEGEPWALTGADGAYTIGVPAGSYLLAEVMPGGWHRTRPDNDVTDSGLAFVQTLKDGVAGVDGLLAAAGVALSPDGATLYAAGAGTTENAVSVFRRDAATGQLTFLQVLKDGAGGVDGLAGAFAAAVSPDGAHVYVAGSTDNAVAVFRRDAASGQLTFVQVLKDGVAGVDGLAKALDLAVSPDGAQVYVAGNTDNAVAVFQRNRVTGQLTFVEVLKDGVSGVDGLAGAYGVRLSPDGAHVYAAGGTDNAVAVFRRHPVTGRLTWLQVLKDGAGGVDGLAVAVSVCVSADGLNVYAAGNTDNAVAVFARDAASGLLTFSQALKDGVGGVDGLSKARWVTASGDGGHVYVTGNGEAAVAVFRRDAASGQLTFAQVLKDAVGGVDGLAGALAVQCSPDGAYVYASGNTDNGLAVFRRDRSSSVAGTCRVSVGRGGSVSGVDFGNVRRLLVIVPQSATEGQVVQGSMVVLDVPDADVVVDLMSSDETEVTVPARVTIPAHQTNVTFNLTIVDDPELDGPQTVTITASGLGSLSTYDTLVVADDESGSPTVDLPVNPVEGSGLLPNAGRVRLQVPVVTDFTVTLASSDAGELAVPASVTLAAGATSVTFNVQVPDDTLLDGPQAVTVTAHVDGWADGRGTVTVLDNESSNLVMTVLGRLFEHAGTVSDAGRVSIAGTLPADLQVNLTSGDATELAVPDVVVIPAGQTSAVFSVTAVQDSVMDGDQAVTVRARAAGLGDASSTVSVLDNHAQLRGAKWLDLDDDAVRDVGEPGLQGWKIFSDANRNGLYEVGEPFALTDVNGNYTLGAPAGTYVLGEVLPAGWVQKAPVQDAIDNGLTDRVTFKDGVAGVDGLAGATGLAISPDGTCVYVAGTGDNALAFFRRNPASGQLTHVQIWKDGVAGVDGLAGVSGVAVSPDGGCVYAAAATDASVAAFRRDPGTGLLTFVQVLKDGAAGVDGLAGARSVAVSPDGAHVYTAGNTDKAVAVFRRDPATGLLTFVQALKDAVGGVDGLDGAYAVTLSPDGLHVYVAGNTDNAVAVFRRNPATGQLTYVQMLKDGVAGVDGLAGAIFVAVSPDGLQVYACGNTDHAVAVFQRDAVNGTLTFVQMLKDGVAGVDGLARARWVAFSPDGGRVLVTGNYVGGTGATGDNSVSLFRRDAVTGQLAYVQTLKDGVTGADGLATAHGVIVSPDGRNACVTGSGDNALSGLALDSWSPVAATYLVAVGPGEIRSGLDFGNVRDLQITLPQSGVEGSALQGTVTLANPAAVDVMVWFATSDETEILPSAGVIVRAGQTTTDFSLNLVDDVLLDWIVSATVTVRADGYRTRSGVIAVHDNELAVLIVETPAEVLEGAGELAGFGRVTVNRAVDADTPVILASGDLTELVVPVGVTLLAGTTSVVFSAQAPDDTLLDGRQSVTLTAQVENWPEGRKTVDVVDNDSTNLTLTLQPTLIEGSGTVADAGRVSISGTLPTDLSVRLFSSDETELLVTNTVVIPAGQTSISIGVTVLDEGLLDGVQTVTVRAQAAGLGDATAAIVVADNYGEIRGVKWLDLDADGVRDAGEPLLPGWTIYVDKNRDGQWTAGEPSTVTDVNGAYALGVLPGSYLVGEVLQAGWLRKLPDADAVDSGLTYVQMFKDGVAGVDGLAGVRYAVASRDGRNVYVAGAADNAIAVFRRDAATGQLTYAQALKDGVAGVDGLAAPYGVAMSADDTHVYVAGYTDNAIAVFRRDAATGQLTFVQVLKDGVAGVDGLAGAYAVAVSSDGAHVYAAGYTDNAVAVFRRDAATGQLTFVQALKDGVGGVDGLSKAISVALSIDGVYVYVAGNGDNAVAVFRRNPATGQLTYVQMLKDGVDGVDGLAGAYAVTLSPDGLNLYAAGLTDNAVAVFRRNPSSGQLTFLQMLKDGMAGVDGLAGAVSVTVSADGATVYATGSTEHGLAVFSRNAATGQLTFQQVFKDAVAGVDGLNKAWMALVAPEGGQVYGMGNGDNAVALFSRDLWSPAGGAWQVSVGRGAVVTGRDFGNVRELILSVPADVSEGQTSSGSVTLTAAREQEVMVRLAVDRPAELTVPAEVRIAAGQTSAVFDVTGVDDTLLDGVQGVLVSAMADEYQSDRRLVQVHDNEASALTVEVPPSVTEGAGVLAGAGRVVAARVVDADVTVTLGTSDSSELTVPGTVVLRAGTNAVPFDVTVPDDGLLDGPQAVTVTAQVENWTTGQAAVTVLDNEHTNLVLGVLATFLEGAGAVAEAGRVSIAGTLPTDLAVSLNSSDTTELTVPDTVTILAGQTSVVFTVTILDDGIQDGAQAVTVQAQAAALGAASAGMTVRDAYAEIRGVKWHDLDADGVRDAGEPLLPGWTIYVDSNRDGQWVTGEPSAVTDANGAYAIGVTPGSYLVGEVQQAGWLRKLPDADAVDSGLTYVQMLKDGVTGVDGLATARFAATSRDGRNVYVVGAADNAVAVFRRDTATGQLTYAQVLKDGVAGVDGLATAYGVAVSPDGAHVYAAGYKDNAIAVFRRDAATGQLTYVQALKDGVAGVDGLAAVFAVTVSPDGAHVYAAGYTDNAVAVFRRDAVTGQLTYVQALKDGVAGVDGLSKAISVTVSADGLHVYAAGNGDNAVAVFRRNPATGQLTYVQMLKDGVGGVDGLAGAYAVTVSPDGLNVYAAGLTDNAVAVFGRNSVSGQLTYRQALKDNAGGVDGLAGAVGVTVSADGTTVYATGSTEHGLAVFSRNAATGQLTFQQVFKDAVAGVDGLNKAWMALVAPEGGQVYVMGSGDNAVALFSRDLWSPAGGAWQVSVGRGDVVTGRDFGNVRGLVLSMPVDVTEGHTVSGSVTLTAAREQEVTVRLDVDRPAELTAPAEIVFAVGQTNASFEVIGADDALLDGVQSVRVRALADEYQSEQCTVQVHDNEATALSVEVPSSVTEGAGVLAGAGRVVVARAVDADVTVTLGGSDSSELTVPATVVLRAGTNAVAFDVTVPDDGLLDGPQAVTVTAQVENWTTGQAAVTVLDNEHTNLVLGVLVTFLEGAGAVAEAGRVSIAGTLPTDLAVSLNSSDTTELTVPDTVTIPAGQTSAVFTVTILDDGIQDGAQAVTVRAQAAALGAAAAGVTVRDAFAEFRGVKWHDLDADGVRDEGEPLLPGWTIYVDSNRDGQWTAGEPSAVTDVNGAYAIGVAPGSYAVKEVMKETWFQLSPGSNVTDQGLSYQQVAKDGVSGVDGLGGATAVEISADGAHIYVVANVDHSVALFRHDPASGQLAYAQVLKDGMAGVDGLNKASDVAMSPDGQNVYVAGNGDNAVAVFRRDATTGQLTFVQVAKDGVGGVDGLAGAISVCVSFDGLNVYAAGLTDNAVAVFRRNPATGQLTYVQLLKDGVGGVDGLAGAYGVEISADGFHVYTVGSTDNAVSVFRRNPATGQLTYVQMLKDGVSGVDGLAKAYALVLSPEGSDVYVAGNTDNAVAVFRRSAATGQLTFTQVLKDGVAGVDGLAGAAWVAVSPDGLDVYVSAATDKSVATFRRDPATGQLTYVQVLKDAVAGVDGLAGARGLVASPDGARVYAVGTTDNAVARFGRSRWSPVSKSRTVVLPLGGLAVNVDFGNTRDFNVVAPVTIAEGATVNSGVVALKAPLTNDLVVTLAADLPLELVVTNRVTIPAGQLTAGFSLKAPEDGDLEGVRTVTVLATASGERTSSAVVQVLDNETATLSLRAPASAQEGDGVLAGAGSVVVSRQADSPIRIDLAGGDLSEVRVPAFVTLAAGQTTVAFDVEIVDDSEIDGVKTAGITAHVAGWVDAQASVAVADNESTNLTVELPVSVREGVGVVSGVSRVRLAGTLQSDLTVNLQSGDETELVAPSNVVITAGDTSAVFELTVVQDNEGDGLQRVTILASATGFGAGSGVVSVVDSQCEVRGRKWLDTDGDGIADAGEPGLAGWTIFADLDQDGENDAGEPAGLTGTDGAYAIGLPAGTYQIGETAQAGWRQTWPVSVGGDSLTFVQRAKDGVNGMDGLAGCSAVALSPDSQGVYAAGSGENSLAVLRRDPLTGGLTAVQVLTDGVNDVDGLAGVVALAVSADGRQVYAAGAGDNALAVFSRSAADQRLTPVQVLRNGQAGVAGLQGVASVAVSPDGRTVLAAGGVDSALAVLSRDAGTGRLAPVQVLTDGVDGVDGLAGVSSVAISPDGVHAYAAGPVDNALAVFRIDAGNGRVEWVQALFDGVGGVDGLGGVSAVCLSPDGLQLYAVGNGEDALTVFQREPASGSLALTQVLRNGTDSVNGLAQPRAVTVSPEGVHVYVASSPGVLSVFRRNLRTGALTFAGLVSDGVDGVDGIAGGRSVAVSPEGGHLYAAGAADSAVAVFGRRGAGLRAGTHTVALSAGAVIGTLDFGSQREVSLFLPVTLDEGRMATGRVVVGVGRDVDVEFTVTTEDAAELWVTNRVVMLAGATSAEVVVQAVVDGVWDPDATVRVRVQAPDYTGAEQSVTVRNVDAVALFRIEATAGLHGQISPAGIVEVSRGDSVRFTISADPYWQIAELRVNGVAQELGSGVAATNYLWSGIAADGTITAQFQEIRAPKGTPASWLAQHKLTNAPAAAEETADADGDGLFNWQEFLADTDPTNGASVLGVRRILKSGGNVRLEIRGGRNAAQIVERRRDLRLRTELWEPVYTSVPPTETSYSLDLPPTNRVFFYRLRIAR